MKFPKDLDLEGKASIYQRPRTALIPMITGPLSALGSYLVIRELWGERSARATNTTSNPGRSSTMRAPLVRTLLAISCTDFVMSIAFAFSTIATPAAQNHIAYAAGNFATCEAQGFLIQYGLTSVPLYTTLLTYFYLVIIKHQWTDKTIRRVEIRAHSIILIVSLGCAIFPLPLKLYNNPYHYCWIDAYPDGCEAWYPDVPCTRGGKLWELFYLIFSIFPLWPCLAAVSIMMSKVHAQVRSMEAVSAKHPEAYTPSSVIHDEESDEVESTDDRRNHASEGESPIVVGQGGAEARVDRSRSRAVARQAMLFVMAFVLTNLLRCVTIVWAVFSSDLNPTLTVLAADVFQPLQGFSNAVVLLHTRKLRTPEGQFIQKLYDIAFTKLAGIGQCTTALCLQCRWRSSNQHHEDTTSTAESATSQGNSIPSENSTREEQIPLKADSLDIFMSPESLNLMGDSELFKDSKLEDVSSIFSYDSIAELEMAAIAKLSKKKRGSSPTESDHTVKATNPVRGLYSESTDVHETENVERLHNDKNLDDEAQRQSSMQFVSDLTEDFCQEQTFESLVDDRFSNHLPQLYESEDVLEVDEDIVALDHHASQMKATPQQMFCKSTVDEGLGQSSPNRTCPSLLYNDDSTVS